METVAALLVQSLAQRVKDHPVDSRWVFTPKSQAEAREQYEYLVALQVELEEKWAAAPLPGLENRTPREVLGAMSPSDWIPFLTEWCETTGKDTLPGPVRQVLLERREETAPVLLELLTTPSLAMVDAPGKGHTPVLAANLLGEMRALDAIPALLDLLETEPEMTPLGDMALSALKRIGDPAREGLYAICERHRHDVDSDPYLRPMEVLTSMAQDDRTWQYLRRGLEESGQFFPFYASVAGDYGDQRAVFHLNTALEERTDLDLSDQQSCLESLEMLGGIPTNRARQMLLSPPASRNKETRVGRNDPCPCGSGKKHKKCCGQQ